MIIESFEPMEEIVGYVRDIGQYFISTGKAGTNRLINIEDVRELRPGVKIRIGYGSPDLKLQRAILGGQSSHRRATGAAIQPNYRRSVQLSSPRRVNPTDEVLRTIVVFCLEKPEEQVVVASIWDRDLSSPIGWKGKGRIRKRVDSKLGDIGDDNGWKDRRYVNRNGKRKFWAEKPDKKPHNSEYVVDL